MNSTSPNSAPLIGFAEGRREHKPSAQSGVSYVPKPQRNNLFRFFLPSIRHLALGAILAFSFVPISFEAGLTYGYLNLSQFPLLVLSLVALVCHFVRFEADILASLFFTFLMAIVQFIGTANSPADHKSFGTPFLFLSSMLIAPAVTSLARSCRPSTLSRLIPRLVNWILVFLVFECVTRLIVSPHMPVTSAYDFSDSFYLYKFSLFFVDSNFVGIEILCLLSLMFAFRNTIDRKRILLAYLLLFATLSRASIAAGICLFIVYRLWRWRGWVLSSLLISGVLVIIKLFIGYATQGADLTKAIDGSLSTKFLLISMMMNIYGAADTLQRLCGVGAGNFVNLSGTLSAHTIVALFIIEFGIVGSVLFLFYIWILSRKCPVSKYLLILPIVINGLSLVSAAAMPYFFATLGLLGALRGSPRDGRGALGLQAATATSEIPRG